MLSKLFKITQSEKYLKTWNILLVLTVLGLLVILALVAKTLERESEPKVNVDYQEIVCPEPEPVVCEPELIIKEIQVKSPPQIIYRECEAPEPLSCDPGFYSFPGEPDVRICKDMDYNDMVNCVAAACANAGQQGRCSSNQRYSMPGAQYYEGLLW